jgi:hypothetical protein
LTSEREWGEAYKQPSTQEADAADCNFEDTVSYITRPYLKDMKATKSIETLFCGLRWGKKE